MSRSLLLSFLCFICMCLGCLDERAFMADFAPDNGWDSRGFGEVLDIQTDSEDRPDTGQRHFYLACLFVRFVSEIEEPNVRLESQGSIYGDTSP